MSAAATLAHTRSSSFAGIPSSAPAPVLMAVQVVRAGRTVAVAVAVAVARRAAPAPARVEAS